MKNESLKLPIIIIAIGILFEGSQGCLASSTNTPSGVAKETKARWLEQSESQRLLALAGNKGL